MISGRVDGAFWASPRWDRCTPQLACNPSLGCLRGNQLNSDDLVSILLTCTPDLVCAFPAAAVRRAGITDVPLMCAQEMNVTGALARVVRVMIHVDLDTPRSDVQHVYLRGAEVLRVDLAVADAQAGESST